MIKLSIAGATGSIGRQGLEVASWFPDKIKIVALSAGRDWQGLAALARQYRPAVVALADESGYGRLKAELADLPGLSLLAGEAGLTRAAAWEEADTCLAAISGQAGLPPLIAAMQAGKQICLANKEALVAAGPLVTGLAKKQGLRLRPVDSEHSAIWQCLAGEDPAQVERLLLTCSGGAFRELSREQLQSVTAAQALKHPNWRMGGKITVDCATLVNKGLEVIEAHWLFGLDYDKIQVLIHPQSVVHSLVAFGDGSFKAQLGPADMRLPIQYALFDQERPLNPSPRLDLAAVGRLDFYPPDGERFPGLPLLVEAGRRGGLVPAYLSAANEALVQAFLQGRLPFLAIGSSLASLLAQAPAGEAEELSQVLAAGRAGYEAGRAVAQEAVLQEEVHLC